ncbi:MAG: TonB-dependent receptor [Candidatus Cloacimonadaceae bacterium]|nr:TonB-dependent receptor [Candidatus Cloacimonadota bacterium]MDY0381489.1 TonB-dependent receptor [Candidatus Cloacimonadaceae bacterium]MCB5276705.1 TonB-dependent receptor [Candidatus Cloacimonadota bacterium]MCK9434221.1 TonB-dependent receptor [Candidatus Cloacimonadota bacterium]MDD2616591.1 TonB-dependent receptor [Candidatus Cloacimonadota bacterium]
MKKSTLILCLILLGCTICHAATVSGFVSREDSGEPIQYVNVRLVDTGAGMQTNKKGYYVINLPGTGTYTLEATLISFEARKFSFTITKAEEDKSLNIKMKEAAIEMATVRVTGSSADEGREIRPSLIRRTTEDVKSVVSPIEADVFRAVLTLPGVAPVSDFSSGLYVRGGSPDQNLILLDDIDVYNPNHFGGVFSTFNSDAVESIDLIKGAYPAKYGGRLSSVLDVTNRQGNRNYHQGVARLSLISSSATLEGPWKIGKQSGSYMGSFRRTYLELIKAMIDDLPDYYFYDGHFKVNWDPGSKDKLSASAYFGRDKLSFDVGHILNLDWGNRTFTTQWVHIFNPRLFSQFIVAGSDFSSNFDQVGDEDELVFRRENGINDISNKASFSWKPNNDHQTDFGWEMKYNQTWLKVISSYEYDPASMPDVDVSSLMSSAFVQDTWDLNELWSVQPGLRLGWYRTMRINLDHIPDASYLNLEPRFSIRRRLDLAESIYASYGLYHQYMTLMSADMSTPFDVWFPLDGSLKPGRSHHFILGYKNQFAEGLAFDCELYYKSYDRILEYDEATDYDWDNDTGELADTFHVGKGYTYGADLLLRTDWHGLEGFIGLTLSKTQRKMEGMNLDPYTHEAKSYYPKYDRSVALSMVQTFNLSQYTGRQVLGADFKVGVNLSINSGQPTEKPERVYFDGSDFQLIYSYKDADRLPTYCRLDLSTKYEWQKSWGSIEPYFEVINVLNRKNVGYRGYSIDVDAEGGPRLKTEDSGQFPLLPFIGVNVKW